MARRRALYPVDTSDRLANVVVASLSTLIVALLALILWMTGTGQQSTEIAEPVVAATEAVSPTPGAPPAVAPTAAPTAPVDRDRVTEPDDVGDAAEADPLPPPPPPADEPTPFAPEVEPTPSPDDGDGRPPPNPGRGSGLYSRDDPDRIPTLVVNSTPRDEQVRFVDLDGDGVDERVWAAIVADQVVIRVDRRVDGEWKSGRRRGAAAADRLVDLRVQDLTGDGRPEVHTKQWVATQGESITLWSYAGDELQRMPVTGGCWNGNNTFGLIGADIQIDADGEALVVAICKDKPLPPQQWPSAVYRWRDGRWTFERLLGEYH